MKAIFKNTVAGLEDYTIIRETLKKLIRSINIVGETFTQELAKKSILFIKKYLKVPGF